MKTKRKNAGQSLVEFALILPLFMVLIMALFDIGRAVLYYAALNTAAREGTRFAIVQPDSDFVGAFDCANTGLPTTVDNICTEVMSKLFNISDLDRSTITIEYSTQNDNEIVQIGIELAYEPITPGLGLIGDFTLSANSQMLLTPIAKN